MTCKQKLLIVTYIIISDYNDVVLFNTPIEL